MLVREIFRVIDEINRAGHDHPAGGAERQHGPARRPPGYVLETGEIILSGTGQELLGDPRVREAYLGG